MSQTVLKQMPQGITPPTVLSFNASSVPILQLALSSDKLSETVLYDQASSFIRPQLASVAGAAIPLPYGGKVRQVQADLNQQALHTYGISANDVVNALSIQNLITPVGTQKIGTFEYTINLNASPSDIAAALTGLMILLFLGNWRSTLIISISIPLAILASLTALSALGETINVMTLGGLALAVGILVDDATVTIENINRHLEGGEEIETSILHGAQEIVVPASISLMCICLAFVPMFGLGGVAGYLFRPLAEAVVFALIASYILSCTLVPTLANYLLRGQAHEATTGPSRNPLVRFQQGFERRFEAIRSGYGGLLVLGVRNRRQLIAGFVGLSLPLFRLAPFLGQDVFPKLDGGPIQMHVRAQTGTRIEETTRLADRIGEAVHQIIPADELDSIVDNIGLSVSGINMAYNNSGTIGVEDSDILISLKPNHAPTADYVRTMRDRLPRMFPSASFAFLPADMVSQILNSGRAA